MSITAQDRAKYAPEIKPYRPPTLIDKANEAVDIREIYNKLPGMYAPWGEYASWKVNCPFNYEHADGGMDKNCRIYGGQHLFCFAMHGIITPVYLWARLNAMPSKRAAEELLEQRGLLRNLNYWEKWEQLTTAPQHSSGSQNYAITALRKELQTDNEYAEHEYDESVRQAWVYALSTLDQLWVLSEGDVEYFALEKWLNQSTKRIRSAYCD